MYLSYLKITLLFSSILSSYQLVMAQTNPVVHELGLNLRSLTQFSLDYKIGSNNKFFHMKALEMNGAAFFDGNTTKPIENFDIFSSVGYESRFKIHKELTALVGTGLSIEYENVTNNGVSAQNIRPGLYIAFGANLLVKGKWSLSLSISPSVGMDIKNQSGQKTTTAFFYDFNFSAVAFTIAYRITKGKD